MEKVESLISQSHHSASMHHVQASIFDIHYNPSGLNQQEPTKEEYREMTEEARLRCLKALKVSFWRQYEQGVLTELAVQILRNAASSAEDKPLRILNAKDLNKYWVLHGVFPWLQIRLTRKFGNAEETIPKPKNA